MNPQPPLPSNSATRHGTTALARIARFYPAMAGRSQDKEEQATPVVVRTASRAIIPEHRRRPAIALHPRASRTRPRTPGDLGSRGPASGLLARDGSGLQGVVRVPAARSMRARRPVRDNTSSLLATECLPSGRDGSDGLTQEDGGGET